MVKPKFLPTSDYAFDANTERIFSYIWNGDSQSIGNILTIRNNETNEIVYSEKQDTLLLKHVLPPFVLINGVLYNATIQVVDRNNIASAASDPILFYCYTTPILTLTLEDNQIIQNSSCTVGISYLQPEGEELQSFKIELYNSYKELIYTSSIRYNIDDVITITSLLDNTTYYLKGMCQTINHMNVETELICIQVDYISPDFYAYITAENRYKFGDIQFTSNLVSIEGHSDNPVFIDDEYVDTINGTDVYFDENFNLNDRYSLILKGYNFIKDKVILSMKNDLNNKISLTWRINEQEKYYLELRAYNNNSTLFNIYFSNTVMNLNSMMNIFIRYKDYRFDLLVQESEVS